MKHNPFSLNLSKTLGIKLPPRLARAIELPIEKAFALDQIGKNYLELCDSLPPKSDFPTEILKYMGVNIDISDASLERIPADGPAIIVANHPFGGIEGIILAQLLKRRRPDAKIMANFLLQRIDRMEDSFIFVDPFGTSGAAKANLSPLRESISWVRDGGLLVIFPSGTVSHFQWGRREILDPDWSSTVARIIKKSGAPVTPLYFQGNNQLSFQIAGTIHPLLRTALLPRELWNKRGKTISVKVGTAIGSTKTQSVAKDSELMNYLRMRTYLLGGSDPGALKERTSFFRKFQRKASNRRLEEISPSVDHEILAAEIAALPPERILGETGDYIVSYGVAREIPNVLQEIGRLRELSFRQAGEGTGKASDLDHFDRYYTHLFVWNRVKHEIVGAYRLAKTDHVLRTHGISGLYTNTLFSYRAELLDQMGPAIELGRSFVRPEYQRNFNSLNLLWKGIARYVAQNPSHPILFGTVSISSEYDTLSRKLIISFLKANRFLPELAKLIRARNPMPKTTLRGVDMDNSSVVVSNIKEVSELLAEIESTQRSVPILLRQYLNLGGKLLGFNLDSDFGNVLDGLIYVDLRETEEKLLSRYMGRDKVSDFYRHHQINKALRLLKVS